MNKEEKEFDLRNYEHYKYYYQDTSKEEIINDTYLDYCAYRNTLTQLDIANNKLKEVKEKCNKELNWIMVEHEGKISNARHVNDLEDILSIIKGIDIDE